jgi:inorganic pyrophosphatase
VHPLHDIAVPAAIEEHVPVVIEIPQGSKLKYEIDKTTGMLMLDRVLYSSVHYPANYGFLPRSHADDGDPLDILVLMQEPVVPLTIVRARAIGGLAMTDDKGGDDKIVAVCVDDPAVKHYRDVSELPPHLMIELERFFRDYKALEGKETVIDEMYGAARAIDVMRAALDAYAAAAVAPGRPRSSV